MDRIMIITASFIPSVFPKKRGQRGEGMNVQCRGVASHEIHFGHVARDGPGGMCPEQVQRGVCDHGLQGLVLDVASLQVPVSDVLRLAVGALK